MAGFEEIKNSEVREDVSRSNGDVEQYYSHQKTMSAIKDFQNIAKVVNVITGFTDMVRKGCFDEYAKALEDIKKFNDEDNSFTLSKYIDIENAEELGQLLNQMSALSAKISNFEYKRPESPLTGKKYIVKNPVKVRITEKIIPKFTTIEYD